MRLRPRYAERALLAGAALALAACTTPKMAKAPGTPSPATRPLAPSGAVKIGKPYQVFGVWYYPSDDRGYDQTGIASWYGPGFHALATANGEQYDQDDVTAAHKTLPMPSYVQVENLDNGRTLTVRINDRGPFVAGRIIDLSRRSAQLLGVDKAGLARVRVRRVFPDGAPPAPPLAPPIVVAAATVAAPPVAAVALPASPPVSPPATAMSTAGQSFVQVAALADPGRIAWLSGYLAGFGPVVTQPAPAGLTRIRLGPYPSTSAANAVLAQVRAAGYSDARLIPPAAR